MAKKYFVVADVHGFFTLLQESLQKEGWDINNKDHILVVCGDLFDRGDEAVELLKFVKSLKNRFIYIRGNHEDLLEILIETILSGKSVESAHFHNGTVDTISQFVGEDIVCSLLFPIPGIRERVEKKVRSKMLPIIEWINKKTVDYCEIGDKLLVHGWVPIVQDVPRLDADDDHWIAARWLNGMEQWANKRTIPDKTVICGHWHVNTCNYQFHHSGSGEFDQDGDFLPFIDDGIIAIDGTTSFSHHVNCIVLDENGVLISDGRKYPWRQ